MDIWTLDFETFFSDDYTLKKLTTEEYIRDERFEALMLGARSPKGELNWYGRDDIPAFLASVDWSVVAVLAHHAQFDGLILSHHYGVKPGAWLDSLSMARLVLGNHVRVGLDSLAAHFGKGTKTVPYDSFRGKRWADIPPALRDELGAGCLDDISLTWEIFCELAKGFPATEYLTIDHTIRCFTEPTFVGDLDALGKVWTDESQRKEARLRELKIDGTQLGSPEAFAVLLRANGVEPQTKVSGKGNTLYAFAKTDEFMKDLLEHDDETVALLAAARLGIKSTIDQSRAERLGFMATRGPMPVYLNYCGAHTTRWSGGDKVNWQNFRRGGGIRKGVRAPRGYKVLKADKSQIECVAHGSLVLTRQGPKPIQDIQLSDEVWDGLEWVAHEGVVCRGEKEVICYQGLTATPDHVVYTRRGQGQEAVALSFAAAHSIDLLPAYEAPAIRQAPLPEQNMQRVQELRRPWHKIQVQVHARMCAVGDGALAAPDLQRHGDRPQEQRWPLRTRQLATFNASQECQQPHHNILGTNEAAQADGNGRLSPRLPRLWPRPDSGLGKSGTDWGRNNKTVQSGAVENCRSVQERPARAIQKVYDIVNAGPRFRFAVSGVIVSNCRILNHVAGQADVIGRFANHEDPYIGIASQFYGRQITKADPAERGVGKQLELSCGYGAGGPTIVATAKRGTYGPPVALTEAEGLAARDLYRATHPAVVSYWKDAELNLKRMANWLSFDWGPLEIKCDPDRGTRRIGLPGQAYIIYDTLEWHTDEQSGDSYWRQKKRYGWTKLYGAKLVENVVQYMSRMDMAGSLQRIYRRSGLRYSLLEHDAGYWVSPDARELEMKDIVYEEMTRTPDWLEGIPLDCDVHVGETM